MAFFNISDVVCTISPSSNAPFPSTRVMQNNVYSKEKCKNCFAKFYCSGGGAANSYNFHGNINDAYDVGCEMQKKRIECAIMIRAAMAEEN